MLDSGLNYRLNYMLDSGLDNGLNYRFNDRFDSGLNYRLGDVLDSGLNYRFNDRLDSGLNYRLGDVLDSGLNYRFNDRLDSGLGDRRALDSLLSDYRFITIYIFYLAFSCPAFNVHSAKGTIFLGISSATKTSSLLCRKNIGTSRP